MMKKYELDMNDTVQTDCGKTLYRIIALHNFSDVLAGEKGGYVQSEANLSQISDCWVYSVAQVYGNARVYGDAFVSGSTKVYENAQVFGSAEVYENAQVFGNARVCGDAQVFGNAEVYENALVYENARVFGDAKVYENALVSGDISKKIEEVSRDNVPSGGIDAGSFESIKTAINTMEKLTEMGYDAVKVLQVLPEVIRLLHPAIVEHSNLSEKD